MKLRGETEIEKKKKEKVGQKQETEEMPIRAVLSRAYVIINHTVITKITRLLLWPQYATWLEPTGVPLFRWHCAVESKARKGAQVSSTCRPSWTVTAPICVSSWLVYPLVKITR